MQLDERRILKFSFFEKSDRESFHLLLGHLKAKKFSIPKPDGGLRRLMPGSHKALWRPDHPEIYDLTSKNHVQGRLAMHQAMHSLMTSRYGAQMQGKSGLTLLTEALACAVEFYFELAYFRNAHHANLSTEWQHYAEFAKLLDRNLEATVKRLANDPFRSFQEHTLYAYEIFMDLLKMVQSLEGGRVVQEAELLAKLESSDHYLFLYGKDFPNFVLFTSTYCGFKRTATDCADTKDCVQILKRSKSMPEFLTGLGVHTT